MTIRIEYLSDHLDAAPLLARLHHDEWKDLLPNWTLDQALAELRTHTGRRQLPTTLVALNDDGVIGSASLFAEDLDGWEHLSPWMGSVYVLPTYRGQGIGRRLVRCAADEAKALEFPSLFLWTAGQQDFYRSLGWHDVATTRLDAVVVTIMRVEFGEDPRGRFVA